VVLVREQVEVALRDVLDPHLQISLHDMGMIYEIAIDGDRVRVEIAYPCLACPAWDDIQNDIRQRLRRIPGVAVAEVAVTWRHAWSKADMTDAGRAASREVGIAL
jgi:metal-sulfur cluster biosynthetic enzyme